MKETLHIIQNMASGDDFIVNTELVTYDEISPVHLTSKLVTCDVRRMQFFIFRFVWRVYCPV